MAVLCLIGEGARDACASWRRELNAPEVRDMGGAAELDTDLPYEELRAWLAKTSMPTGIDAAAIPPGPRKKRLLLADMDSTIIGQECLDELADLAGHGEAVARVTEAAMRGEIGFAEALRGRVKTLEGLPEEVIGRVLEERITLNPGARTLTATMRAHGARCVLVSGGFTSFTGPVAERAGFDEHHGNTLLTEGGRLTGRVADPILGREAKKERLDASLEALGLAPEDALCVGDGANDLGMITAVPLGVAFRAKPVVARAAPVKVTYGDLTALLYLQGIPKDEWADA
ncbi:phosphoserine phosphatase SerB [Parvularcula dongshanensis]|uniref:Phosphoserine phosphatase n=1 Tax=Parvularcula dongshanensis TaxID=1173995 RepID=A0A840I3U8_9PROT|nr:phosphoserine phosphatase SerB [Parvularcula dongshanensis]MBB4659005.1 phosphoserine phosphatase [Parvularcula dongshanensis]